MRGLPLGLFAMAFASGVLFGADEVAPTPSATPNPATFVPEVARVAAKEGNDAFEQGDFNTARDAYRRVLDLAPENPVALVNLGVVEFRSGNFALAEDLLKRAIRVHLENAPAWLTLGILYYEQNQIDPAIAALAQATVFDPGDPRAFNFFGAALSERGWRDAAESALRRAVQIDPASRDAHYNLSRLYLERNPPAFELARRHYYRSVELGAERDIAIEKQFALD